MHLLPQQVIFTIAIINLFNGALSNKHCKSAHETLIICPGDQEISDGGFSLTCPNDHTLTDLQATAYKSHGINCPSQDSESSCFDYEMTGELNGQLRYCVGHQNCLDVKVPAYSLKQDACPDHGFVGNVYYNMYTVFYLCQPRFSGYFNGSAWAIAMDSTTTRSASMININSLASALLGNFVNVISTYCSVTIPAGLDVIIRPLAFITLPQKSGGQCVEILDKKDVHRLCSTSDHAIFLGCADRERRLKIAYNTSDERVSVVFVVQLQVSHTSRISATCGIPSSNLMTDEDEEEDEESKDSKATQLLWNVINKTETTESKAREIPLFSNFFNESSSIYNDSKTEISQNKKTPLFWNLDYYIDYDYSYNQTFSGNSYNQTFAWNNSLLYSIIECRAGLCREGFLIVLAAVVVGGLIVVTMISCVIYQIIKRRRVGFNVQQNPSLMKDNVKSTGSFTPIDGDQKLKLVGDTTAFDHA